MKKLFLGTLLALTLATSTQAGIIRCTGKVVKIIAKDVAKGSKAAAKAIVKVVY